MYKSNINFNLYKTFYEVAIAGSITEAAKKSFTSQPAISKAIKRLEEELQVNLFYRNLNGTELTEKGKELFFYVEEAFNSLVTAERSMIETETLERGKISIGVPSQVASFYLFDNISEFHKMYSNIEITIISKSTDRLLKLLETHEIDFIVDTSPIITDSKNLIIKPLKKVKNCFVFSKQAMSINGNKIKYLKDLEDYPLILPVKGAANREELDKAFDNNNVNINNVINIYTSEMIIEAVKKGLGIGYIMYDTVKGEIEDGTFSFVNINEKLPMTTINLVYIEKYLTNAPLQFIKEYIDSSIEV